VLDFPHVSNRHFLHEMRDKADSAKLMFGSDRIGQEDKFFRRVQYLHSLPLPYREDLCHRTATRVYRLAEYAARD
jgi:predicted TIM-barrel fold metal-dependent hydrolase